MRPKNLQRITTKFGRAYARSKRYDERKEAWKKEFFAAVTQAVERERRLPQRGVVTTHDESWVRRNHPGYRVIDKRPATDMDGGTYYILERDPGLVPFTYINPEDGMVYQRGTQEAGPSLDDERLKEEDPLLWLELTEEVRVVRDPSTWTEDQMNRVQSYMIPGSIKAKLIPPRPAKPEELEAQENDD